MMYAHRKENKLLLVSLVMAVITSQRAWARTLNDSPFFYNIRSGGLENGNDLMWRYLDDERQNLIPDVNKRGRSADELLLRELCANHDRQGRSRIHSNIETVKRMLMTKRGSPSWGDISMLNRIGEMQRGLAICNSINNASKVRLF